MSDIVCSIILFCRCFFYRTNFFIGIGVADLYFLCSSFSILYKIKVLCRTVLFIILASIAIWTVLPSDLQVRIYNLFLYVFEFWFNYTENGAIETTSTDHLFNDMYFPITLSTFFFGDGLYTGYDGAYYMHTDSGYMRNILYMGIGGLVLLILLDIYMILGQKKMRERKMLMFGLFVLLYLGITHVKGEIFGYSLICIVSFSSTICLIYLYINDMISIILPIYKFHFR